jgi:hypothetical protein
MKGSSDKSRKDFNKNNIEKNKRLERLKPESRNRIGEDKRKNKREERLNNVQGLSRNSARLKGSSMNK